MNCLSRWLALLGASAALIGCSSSNRTSSIRDDQEYMRVLQQTQELTLTKLAAYESGQTLNEAEKADLTQGLKLFERMIDYAPTLLGPQVGAGRICRALGDNDHARHFFEQALNLQPTAKSQESDELRASVFANLAEIDLIEKKYEEAELLLSKARSEYPEDAKLMVLQASVDVQTKRIPEAKKLLAEAIRLDPANSRARSLQKLIESAKLH